MGKKIDGVRVPKRILGRKLRKGTRKDIAALMKTFGQRDAKSMVMTAVAAAAPLLAERLIHRRVKLKPAK